jgi:hypothetical protein
MREFKVGISASLDASRTVHTRAFLNSVALFNQVYDSPLHLVWADDGANAEMGSRAATTLKRNGVDVVVGHFASDAARAALQVYSGTDIAVLLPAATLPELTQFGQAHRVCCTDNDLIAKMAHGLGEMGYGSVFIHKDESVHGRYVADRLGRALPNAVIDIASADALVFCGRYEAAKQFLLARHQEMDSREVWLTDDALCDALLVLAERLSIRIKVVSYRPGSGEVGERLLSQYRQQYASFPGPYFSSTIASLEICVALSRGEDTKRSLLKQNFSTSFGDVRFVERESGFGEYIVFDLANDSLLDVV